MVLAALESALEVSKASRPYQQEQPGQMTFQDGTFCWSVAQGWPARKFPVGFVNFCETVDLPSWPLHIESEAGLSSSSYSALFLIENSS